MKSAGPRGRVAVVVLVVLGVLDLIALDLVAAPRYLRERSEGMIVSTPEPTRPGPSPPPFTAVRDPAPPSATAPGVGEVGPPVEEPAVVEPPAPPAEEPPAVREPTAVDGRSRERLEPILFRLGSAELPGGSRRDLWTAVWTMRRSPGLRVLVRGLGDGGGGDGELARGRAEAAAAFMQRTGGLQPGRIFIEAGGARAVSEGDRIPAGRVVGVELEWR